MKIPRRLNAALDWIGDHARVMLIVVSLVIAAVAVPWMPALAALVVGVGAGSVAVHFRMSKRVARLRAEVDDLLRENGALRHRRTMIAQANLTSESVLTQRLPTIPEEREE
ncbi:hypothetical protein [Actinoallomurus iriomotensis]|uniref:Uncharacterized protein n=1 Tax=Actinoallomurus iriomotensis TaxID=478107 RepID=A0A9W6S6U4_9ACTN|nr:hypothetical protein [Actinoallomurus iriomotensis]GLY86762.1 hypothetical protein Airi02_046910 [Actinoallomurus iriomotensis]